MIADMKIYNVIWEDKHADTEVYSFTDIGDALEYVRKQIKNCYLDRYDDLDINYTLTDAMKSCNWVFFAHAEDTFSLRIVRTELEGI
jgi:heme oxygenase